MTDTEERTFQLVVVNAGVSEPSSTGMLASRVAQRVAALAGDTGERVRIREIALRELLPELPGALGSQLLGPKFTKAVEALAEADGVIAAAPVYKAGPSGLFTAFFQVLENDLLIAKPTLLAATAGTARHALVVDDQMRGLFAYLRALVAPTSLFAAEADWQDPAFGQRVDRAARELLLLMRSGFERSLKQESWNDYRHEFGSVNGGIDVDLESELMRLATGGGLPPQPPRMPGAEGDPRADEV